jgi:quercetin dioxygenase-like cupin family protein
VFIQESPANREQLQRYLESTSLSEGSKRLLEYLADLTMRGDSDQLTGGQIANALYMVGRDDSEASQRKAQDAAIHAAKRLRHDLESYKANEASTSESLFVVPKRGWGVEHDTGHEPPTPLRSLAARREEDHDISVLEFKRFLEQLCDLEGDSQLEMNAGARAWWEGTDPYRTFPLPPENEFDAVMDELGKRENDRATRLRFSEMTGLAQQMGVHPIMLDPLLSTEVPENCICLQYPGRAPEAPDRTELRQGKFAAANKPKESSYGKGADYYIPDIRLSNTDASFVYLVLRPKGEDGKPGHSDDHHHGGDELLLVLRGCIEVRLADSGGRVQLNEGSFIHFYAEQTHSAHFVSGEGGEAHAFIIRFYQRDLVHPDSRQALRKRLRDGLGRRDPKLDLDDELFRGWILESSATRSIRSGRKLENITEVANKFGTARLLRSIRLAPSAEHRLLDQINTLDPMLRGSNYVSIADWLSDLAIGKAKVPKALIPSIHSAYDMFRLLLWDFLFPGVIRVVVIHRDRPDPADRDWVPLRKVAPNASVSEGVRYEIPIRTLACSDLTISWVRIERNKLTPNNSHPGCELLIPMKGEIAVVFGNEDICRVRAGQNIAHYSSDKPHRARNPASEPAEMLVIRFLGEIRSEGTL